MRSIHAHLRAALLAALCLCTLAGASATPHTAAHASSSIDGLHVAGATILNSAGAVVRLLGINHSGSEYACIQGWGMTEGTIDQAFVNAVLSWHVNALRLPLNEDCWLGINNAAAAYSGQAYRDWVSATVALLVQNGIVPILDLHWSAPGTTQATGQQDMPDRDHSLDFWRSVAATFGGNQSVVFEAYNEPHPGGNGYTDANWSCWKSGSMTANGGSCTQEGYAVAGMQDIVTAIRGTGAANVILLGGPCYAQCFTGSTTAHGWLQDEPSDPAHNLAAVVHAYRNAWFLTTCADGDATCIAQTATTQYGPTAAQAPLVATELGDASSPTDGDWYVQAMLTWLDGRGASYTAWTWNTWNDWQSLITDYTGTPTSYYGADVKSHITNAATTLTLTPTATTLAPTAVSSTTTPTPVPPSATAPVVMATDTTTAVPPTATASAVPPTATTTAVPPTATTTATKINATATATAIVVTPTATATLTVPTITATATATVTKAAATATPAPTQTTIAAATATATGHHHIKMTTAIATAPMTHSTVTPLMTRYWPPKSWAIVHNGR